jgi:NAD(P)-dependent dehydrogenase (short-subunit alcohol dehydrogenase family)
VSEFIFKSNSILVVGGTAGIGFEVAKIASECGAQVHLMARGHDLEKTKRILESLSPSQFRPHTFTSVDVSDATSFDQALKQHIAVHGVPDRVFHNVGKNAVGQITDVDIQLFNQSFDLNVRSAFILLRRMIPSMIESGKGVILINSSVKGLVSHPEDPIYCASKAALIALMKSTALTVASKGVRVNCICPGPVKTRQFVDNPAVINRIPMGRAANSNEVANVACYLLSDQSSYITGSAIPVDGGKSAGIFPPFDTEK